VLLVVVILKAIVWRHWKAGCDELLMDEKD
jgi:hypothetical protein